MVWYRKNHIGNKPIQWRESSRWQNHCQSIESRTRKPNAWWYAFRYFVPNNRIPFVRLPLFCVMHLDWKLTNVAKLKIFSTFYVTTPMNRSIQLVLTGWNDSNRNTYSLVPPLLCKPTIPLNHLYVFLPLLRPLLQRDFLCRRSSETLVDEKLRTSNFWKFSINFPLSLPRNCTRRIQSIVSVEIRPQSEKVNFYSIFWYLLIIKRIYSFISPPFFDFIQISDMK